MSVRLANGQECGKEVVGFIPRYGFLPAMMREQIQRSLEHYKDLEPGKSKEMPGWGDAVEARKMITKAIERARQSTSCFR